MSKDSRPTNRVQLQRLQDIDAALGMTTETLARELVTPAALAPSWDEFHWRIARATAVIHGISPLLAARLRWRGPPAWREFLQEERRQVELRHARIERQLELIDESARAAGVEVMALKGAALHRLGFCVPGERPMADIDLLVAPGDADQVAGMICALEYREAPATWRHRSFEPLGQATHARLGEQASLPIKIEVHTAVAERLPVNKVDITRRLGMSGGAAGVGVYRTIEATLLHQLLHAAGNMSSHWLRLLQLHDIATISRKMTPLDWSRLLEADKDTRALWWAYPPLKLAARYFPDAIPAELLAELAPRCQRRLRSRADRYRLADVASSGLWARAAPAAAWAPSLTELCRYLWRRAVPPRDEMATLGTIARGQSWAAMDSWYGASQARRMLRWISSRPARPQILLAVQMAQDLP